MGFCAEKDTFGIFTIINLVSRNIVETMVLAEISLPHRGVTVDYG